MTRLEQAVENTLRAWEEGNPDEAIMELSIVMAEIEVARGEVQQELMYEELEHKFESMHKHLKDMNDDYE